MSIFTLLFKPLKRMGFSERSNETRTSINNAARMPHDQGRTTTLMTDNACTPHNTPTRIRERRSAIRIGKCTRAWRQRLKDA